MYKKFLKAEQEKAKKPKHSDEIRSVAESYAKNKGFELKHPEKRSKVNPERAKKIADAYHEMKHDPTHPEVKNSYNALINETLDQFNHIKDNTNMKFSKIKPGMKNPYANSKELHHDIRNNNHMWYFPTEQGFGSDENQYNDHPMLQSTKHTHDDGSPMLANDVFRIVHDYFGHSKEGSGFGPHGEEHAWNTHRQMYSPQARKALTTETRGQNSWVNFGPHAEHNRSNPAETIYADQKAGILPDWAHDHDDDQMNKNEDMPNLQPNIAKKYNSVKDQKPHFIFSAENPLYDDKKKLNMDHDQVIDFLRNRGYKAESMHGKYGQPEKSIIVHEPPKHAVDNLLELSAKLGQESSIYSDGYNHEMHFHHGDNAGHHIKGQGTEYHKKPPEDLYSSVGDTHFTHNFNFDEIHPHASSSIMSREDEGVNKSEKLEKGARGDWRSEGYKLKHFTDKHGIHHVHAFHPSGERVGEAQFWDDVPGHEGKLYVGAADVDEDHRRKGLASGMYAHAEKHFSAPVVPSKNQTSDASKLWQQKNRPFGKSEQDERYLEHYSPQQGLKTINPQASASTDVTQRAAGNRQSNLSFYYPENYETPEQLVTGKARSKYKVKLQPEHKIFDVREHGRDLIEQSKLSSGHLDIDKFVENLQSAGYHGFRSRPQGLDMVAMFHELPVHSEEPIDKAENVGSAGFVSSKQRLNNRKKKKWKTRSKLKSTMNPDNNNTDNQSGNMADSSGINSGGLAMSEKYVNVSGSHIKRMEIIMKGNFKDKVKSGALGVATAAAMSAPSQVQTQQAPQQVKPPRQEQAVQYEDPAQQEQTIEEKSPKGAILEAIAQVESSGGRDTAHVQLPKDSIHRGERAYGSYGLTPVLIRETVAKHPDLRKEHGKLTRLRGQDVHDYMKKNPKLEHELASRHYDRLAEHFGHDPAKIGYAWLNGITGAKKAISQGKNLHDHWHVKKVLKAYEDNK